MFNKEKTYFIAELSGNHNHDINRAKAIIDAAADAGADAVKLQTYTADTITLNCDSPLFKTSDSSLWKGTTLYELYKKAYTPWEWHEELIKYANEKGLDCFSSPFDLTAVEFLEKLNVPAYKIASPEINDIPLLRSVARTGKPILISTGIAYLEDIDLAVRTCKEEGNGDIILLKCVSEYPTSFESMNLRSIQTLQDVFDCPIGLSDHSMGTEAAVAAVTLGAKVIEKHLTLSRAEGGVDSAFSMEPQEFKDMVSQVRNIEKALGKKQYELTPQQIATRKSARSLFVAEDIKAGEVFTEKNVRSVRPGAGMHTKYYEDVLGKKAGCDLKMGTPMDWKYVEWCD